jgi:hypothetical protein
VRWAFIIIIGVIGTTAIVIAAIDRRGEKIEGGRR